MTTDRPEITFLESRHDRGAALAAPITGRIYQGVVARVHTDADPLVYGQGEKSRKEMRRRDEVQRICDQLPGTKVTLLHPANGGMLAEGATPKIVGRVVDARMDGDQVVADILITDPDTEQAIRLGAQELSLGYYSGLQDGYQSDIKVDHLAVLPRGRCGAQCRMRVDGACGCTDSEPVAPESCSCKNHAMSHNGVSMGADAKQDETLNAGDRHKIASSNFAIPSREALPIENQAHVEDAMARFGQTDFQSDAEKKTAYHKIVARAHELGMDSSGFEKKWGSRLDSNTGDGDTHMDEEFKKQLAAAIKDAAEQRARADGAEQALAAAKSALTAAEVLATNATASLATEKARADQAETDAKALVEKARTDSAAEFDVAVADRVAVLTAANRVLGAVDKDGKPVDRSKTLSKDLKIAVIKHVDSIDVSPDKEIAFIDGVYYGSLERHGRGAQSLADARVAIETKRQDAAPNAPAAVVALPSGADLERAARENMINTNNTRWIVGDENK